MEYKSLSKLLVLLIFLGLLQGSIFTQDIQHSLKADSIACDTFPPPRNLNWLSFDNTVKLWWEFPFLYPDSSSSHQNLYAYVITKDSVAFDTVLFTGEDTTEYYDNLGAGYPVSHEYFVSAIFDLSPCGISGEYGESQLIGPVTIYGFGGFILSFIEDWNTGSFDPNLWTADEYWYTSGPYGYPPPCATYSNFPDSAYTQALTSWWIDCMNHPGTGMPYIVGDYYFEYDIALNHLPMSGTDYLDVKISDSLDWYLLEQYSTDTGSFGWHTHSINITERVRGKLIRINFTAHGEDGANIQDWYIDNIHVYRKCNPPRELHWVTYDNLMAWSSPLPHSYNKNNSGKEILGYNVYYDNSHLGFTTDTFYSPNPPLGYGLYYVTAVYEDCEPESNHIYSPVGITEIEKNPEIKVFPNPCDAKLSIHSSEPMQSIQVFNAQGVILLDQECKVKMMDIDTSPFPSGIYFLQTHSADKIQLNKIIIHH